MLQLLFLNCLVQFVLGNILNAVFKLHTNNNHFTRSEWLMQKFLTWPLAAPSLCLMARDLGIVWCGERLVVKVATVISIVPATLVTLYILSKVSS